MEPGDFFPVNITGERFLYFLENAFSPFHPYFAFHDQGSNPDPQNIQEDENVVKKKQIAGVKMKQYLSHPLHPLSFRRGGRE